MAESLKRKTYLAAVWTMVERLGNQTAGFCISIVLARLLSPSDYGVVGLLTVFLAISNLFIDAGFTSALIQKKDRTATDFSTVFWCNLSIAIVCYIILFLASPWIAKFYDLPVLKNMVRILGIVLIIHATYATQVTRLTANLNFKTQAKVSFANCVLGGVVGISLAYLGFGPWALVAQSVFSAVFCGVVYWVVTDWHPSFVFSNASFKRLFSFGSRLLAANLLHTIYTNISPVIIGRKYSAAALGMYSRADSLVQMPGGMFQSTLGRIIFPVLASIQDDEERLRAAYNKYLRIMVSLVAPAMLLLATVSEPLILTLIGSKWIDCVPYIMLLAVAWMVDPITRVNLNVLSVKGRTDVVLKLEIVKKIIAISIVVIFVQFGVLWLCIGRVLYSFIGLSLNVYVCGPFIGMSFGRQISEVWRIYASGFVSALCAYFVVCIAKAVLWSDGIWWHYFATLLLAGLAGLGMYIVLAFAFRFDIVDEGRMLFAKARNRICR